MGAAMWFLVAVLTLVIAAVWLYLSHLQTVRWAVPRSSPEKPLRVAVVGAGAAGMAAAYSLSRSGAFRVSVFDSNSHCGGVATSENLAGTVVNDGVQGGARATYQNVLELHRQVGMEADPVSLRVSFGTGKRRWDNSSSTPTEFMRQHQEEMVRFATLMRW